MHDLLLHREVSDVEGLHAEMVGHTVFYGRKGIVVMAISGVDLALWDLRGKAAGKSIGELLNPNWRYEQWIPTYTTVFNDSGAEAAIQAGVSAIKLHVERFGPRPEAAQLAELVQRARERLGAGVPIMLDAFGSWDEDTTRRVADQIARFDIDWLEEPLPPDDLDGYERLSSDCAVPIAGGEHEYLSGGFRELIDRRLHAVLQPDVNWCGGLTSLIEIYNLAAEAGIRVCPHRGSEAFALPAIAALDPAPLAESPRSWFNCLLGAPRIEAGRVRPSNDPGFGVSLRSG